MAGRVVTARTVAILRFVCVQSAQLARIWQPSPFLRPALFNPVQSFDISRNTFQRRSTCTGIAKIPDISDLDARKALHKLLAVNWHDIDEEARDAVEAALTKQTDDKAGQEELANAWRAAEAVEKYSGTIIAMRMALDDLSGLSGQKVRPLPPTYVDALNAVLKKYQKYLAAFKPEEYYLKKKVEVELGGLLVHLRQRCSGLGPEWGDISVLGTSGLAGSFVELRSK